MSLYQEFNSIVSKLSYFDDSIKRILRIFEGTGDNQIITSETIPSTLNIKDFIIASDQIERGLSVVHNGLRQIQEENEITSGNLFYFSQYGGSKTQFLNLLLDEMNSKIPNCIIVLFENLHHINPLIIFESIFSQIFQVIAKIPHYSANISKYRKLSNELRQYTGEVHVAIRQSSNLKKAEEILNNLRKIKNPEYKKQINELDKLLHSTILVDSVKILNKIINLMQYCSQNGIVFLFLFDEVDLWLDERSDDLRFSQDFNRISDLMKNILEIPDNKIKVFMVFACTDRVNRLFQTMQHKFEARSPVASRLNRIYNSADKVIEPGNYGAKIQAALIKLSAYYHLANNRVKIETDILEQALPVLEEKYKFLSRRMANSKIIQMLKNYQILTPSLKIGLKNWKSNAQYYGNIIQANLPSILNRLTIKFVRKDIPVSTDITISRDKIDGYFVNYSLNNEEIRTCVEIKLTSQFKGDKSYQALQFLQLHPKESLIMIIFSPTELEKIKKEINQYSMNQGYDSSVNDRLYFILIKNPIAFCPIIGITKVSSDSEMLLEFLEAYANWIEFFGSFSSQYQRIKQEIGIDYIAPVLKPEGSEEKEKKEKTLYKLNPDEQTCLNLLSKLYIQHKFTKTGRMNKTTIQKFIEDNSLGIADLEKYYELMDRSDVIDKITKSTITFTSDIINVHSLDDLQQNVSNYFQRVKDSSENLTTFF